jgi:hypothetical protein
MFVEPEKRENCCPYARFYKYRTIGVQKTEKEAVKCLLKGNVYDADYIKSYCSAKFEGCELYKREVKIEEWRSPKSPDS